MVDLALTSDSRSILVACADRNLLLYSALGKSQYACLIVLMFTSNAYRLPFKSTSHHLHPYIGASSGWDAPDISPSFPCGMPGRYGATVGYQKLEECSCKFPGVY